jgi:hypothetical protein
MFGLFPVRKRRFPWQLLQTLTGPHRPMLFPPELSNTSRSLPNDMAHTASPKSAPTARRPPSQLQNRLYPCIDLILEQLAIAVELATGPIQIPKLKIIYHDR